ncbi:ABC transporter related protein [Candidatus Arthromitus sp. SFB-2]|nr:ABC transporter related protein [Candidatus Arthromitus sp. SFB-2]
MMMSLKNITKFYKDGNLEYRALYNISFDIDYGEYVFIYGGSGSGKTTLLNILGCMDTFDYGKYTFCDMDIGNKKDIELSRLRNENLVLYLTVLS